MNNDIERAKFLSDLLLKSRKSMNKSQDYMAMGLGVSKNTIYNWEKGTARPDVFQLCDWFELLGLNPTPFILQFTNPHAIKDISPSAQYDVLLKAYIEIIQNIPEDRLRQKLYQEYGTHGSDAYSLDQLFNAYLHLPLEQRMIIAQIISNVFSLCEKKNELINTDHQMPNVEALNASITCAQEAAIKKQFGYSINDKKS